MELLVAADLYGMKQNIKFVFQTRPTLKEFVAQIELAFQKEAVSRQPPGGELHHFEVSNVQVYSEDTGGWADVIRQGQLSSGMQYYAFQLRGTNKDKVALFTRARSASPGCRSLSRGRSASSGGNDPLALLGRASPSSSHRRSTSITERQSHYIDGRARTSREGQALRTLSNDRRYTTFHGLAPTGRLDLTTLRSTLLARGAALDEALHLEYAMAGMEAGQDGCASYAQFSRFFRRNPGLSVLLRRCIGGGVGPVPDLPPEPHRAKPRAVCPSGSEPVPLAGPQYIRPPEGGVSRRGGGEAPEVSVALDAAEEGIRRRQHQQRQERHRQQQLAEIEAEREELQREESVLEQTRLQRRREGVAWEQQQEQRHRMLVQQQEQQQQQLQLQQQHNPVEVTPPPEPDVSMRSWLETELSRLDVEHQEKVRRVREQFDRMQAYENSVCSGGQPAPSSGPHCQQQQQQYQQHQPQHQHSAVRGVSPLLADCLTPPRGVSRSPGQSVENVYRQLADNLALADVARTESSRRM